MRFQEKLDAYTWAEGLFLCEEEERVRKACFRHVRYKGGSSTTVNQSYTPTPGEVELTQASADYARRVAPNAYYLNDVARKVLEDSLGTVQVDYNALNQNALGQYSRAASSLSGLAGANDAAAGNANRTLGGISSQVGQLAEGNANRLGALSDQYAASTGAANRTLSSLAEGKLPAQYQANMQNSIASALKSTMGKTLASLGNRGVLNSSVTARAMNDIEKNASDELARQYQGNIWQAAGLAQQQLGNSTSLAGNLGNLYNTQYAQLNGALGQQGALAQQQLANTAAGTQANAGLYSALMNSAGTPLTLSAAAQEAAQQPAINLWNMSLGLNGANASALAGVAGKGTSSQTTTQSGGGGFLGGLFGGALTGAANAYGGLWCFPPETMVRMADGSEKKIAHIEVGERVMGIGKDGKECPATVMHKLDDHADMVYNVCCKNGHAMTTLSQPLMKDDGSFVLVRDLRIGDVLKGGGMLIGIIEAGDRPLCDLQTDGENNYIADGFVAKGGDPAIWG